MARKTRKAQVVIAGYDAKSQSLAFLLMQTNEQRGSYWQNVTGKIDSGETYQQGALREVIEETKLDPAWIVNFVDLHLSHDFIDDKKRNVHEKSFLCLVDRIFEVKIDPHEHQNHQWEKDISRPVVKHLGNFEALEKAIRLIEEEYT